MDDQLTEEKRGWLLPNRYKKTLRPGLYLVATPIGNLGDITIRALDTLAAADIILCEDTRVTGKLLQAYDLGKKMQVYNDHSTEKTRLYMIDQIKQGQSIALVSDAGSPLIADPGYKLVQNCVQDKLLVTSIPGANAALTAIQLSGFPSDNFTFIGFLPSKSKARQDVLTQWQNAQSTLVAYDTAPRLLKSLADIASIMPTRPVAVTRELTKLYEEVKRGVADELIKHYETHGLPKGEIVLVIHPPAATIMSEDDIINALKTALKTMSSKEAVAAITAQSGQPKKTVYNLALGLK